MVSSVCALVLGIASLREVHDELSSGLQAARGAGATTRHPPPPPSSSFLYSSHCCSTAFASKLWPATPPPSPPHVYVCVCACALMTHCSFCARYLHIRTCLALHSVPHFGLRRCLRLTVSRLPCGCRHVTVAGCRHCVGGAHPHRSHPRLAVVGQGCGPWHCRCLCRHPACRCVCV
jgi:hypothetical protein